jgi:CheY-like chemotaxis protein
MTHALEAVVALIPRLRRHARLLAGSQEVGDEYVRICLELIAAEPARLEDGPLVQGLFRSFHLVVNRVGSALEAEPDDTDGNALQVGLRALPSLQRRAILLQVVERFSPQEVGLILDLDPSLVVALVSEAREDLMRSEARSVLIIEDEPMIAMDLSRIVREMGHRVVALAGREASAQEQAERHTPGLVLADVRLADDDSGIVAAQNILRRFDVPVVFVTGFPERLLTGGQLEPAFVIAKPYNEEALKVMIDQALRTYGDPDGARRHKAALLDKLADITGPGIGVHA